MMPMRHVSPIHMLLAAACLLLAGACDRVLQPEGREIPVLLSLDTKAVDPGYKGTFRVALFDANGSFTGRTGSYCTTTQSHTDANSSTIRTWLDPCKVDAYGNPLDDAGDIVSLDNLAGANHDGVHGLRWGGTSSNAAVENVSLAAVSPAVAILPDGSENTCAYVNWTPDAALYISDPKSGSFTGTWVDGEYVYTSATKIPTLQERRASVTVRIECGEQPEGYIQSVTLNNHITSARYYLMAKDPYAKGFSFADGHFTTAQPVLYDCGAGAPDHLVRANNDFRVYEKIYFPAVNFSADALASVRPEFIIKLGSDKEHPIVRSVVLDQDLAPMTHYTLTLRISISQD